MSPLSYPSIKSSERTNSNSMVLKSIYQQNACSNECNLMIIQYEHICGDHKNESSLWSTDYY